MEYKFNWLEGNETVMIKDKGDSITKQEVASFITTCGAIIKEKPLDISDKLAKTDLTNCEMKLTVNGVELNIDGILGRLSDMIKA